MIDHIDLEYHKGSLCPLKYLICQEGYCAECRISREQTGRPRREMPKKKAVPVLARTAFA